jgi:ribosomal protein L16 Arg81 hydroxylase
MGYDFASYFPGSTTSESPGDSMTEIEIFVSKKGNYTDFHMDFQENFTFQLKGSKKWRLKTEHGMQAPVLGFSPHYSQS